MRLITKNTDYAMRALVLLARTRERLVSVREIAGELGISLAFLRGILQVLNTHGILASSKGKGGGFRLAKPPAQILLADLVAIFQGGLTLRHCLVQAQACPNLGTCLLHTRLLEAERRLQDEIAALSIEVLAKEAGRTTARRTP